MTYARRICSWLVATTLCVTAVAGCRNHAYPVRLSDQPALLEPHGPAGLRVMTYNVARGGSPANDANGAPQAILRHNLTQVGHLIEREAPHVVALQEIDTTSPWTTHFDSVIHLGRAAGYPHAFLGLHTVINWFGLTEPKILGGGALLGRLELTDRLSVKFATSLLDSQGFVVATVSVPAFDGLEVDVVSLHLNPESSDSRVEQVEILTRHLEKRRRPLVIMGDFNNGWGPDPVDLLAKKLDLKRYRPDAVLPTFPAHDPRARLDWILISQELDFATRHTLQEPLSDHLPVMATIIRAE